MARALDRLTPGWARARLASAGSMFAWLVEGQLDLQLALSTSELPHASGRDFRRLHDPLTPQSACGPTHVVLPCEEQVA